MSGSLTEGGTFGDYRVARRLGKGGMGEVWLLQSASGGFVAVKILDPETAADHEARKRFLHEAEFALGVEHPNLVETYDVGEDPDTGLCYILMEYVSGGTLADRLFRSGAMPVDEAVSVVRAMADILELGRQKGIVHRDIKPANIMFASDGTPKLADLGIARGGNLGTDTTTVTQTGMMIGTPAYMSPEQMLDAHNVDTRADIYSLGVVFFEMLTGERPNKDDTVMQLMAKAVKGEPLPDVRMLRPDVPASFANLLSMMVAPDKDKRISSPGQITNAIALIERGESFGRLNKMSWPLAQFGRIKRLPRSVLIPIGVLALLIVIIFAILPGEKRNGHETVTRNAPSFANGEKPVPTNVVKRTVKKVGKSDFKVNLTGVAVIEDDTPSNADHTVFASPTSRLEVFGRTALFKLEYDFPTNHAARLCVLNWQTTDKDGRPVSFMFGQSSDCRGKGIAVGRIILDSNVDTCELHDIQIAVTPTPRIEGMERSLLLGPFSVNIRFVSRKARADTDLPALAPKPEVPVLDSKPTLAVRAPPPVTVSASNRVRTVKTNVVKRTRTEMREKKGQAWSSVKNAVKKPSVSPSPSGRSVSHFQSWPVVLGKAYAEDSVLGRRGQVLTQSHVLFARTVKIPRAGGFPKPQLKLSITVACEPGEKSYLFARVSGVPVGDRVISSSTWKTHEFDVSRWEGKDVFIEVDCSPSERNWSRVHWQQIKVK